RAAGGRFSNNSTAWEAADRGALSVDVALFRERTAGRLATSRDAAAFSRRSFNRLRGVRVEDPGTDCLHTRRVPGRSTPRADLREFAHDHGRVVSACC